MLWIIIYIALFIMFIISLNNIFSVEKEKNKDLNLFLFIISIFFLIICYYIIPTIYF